MRIATPAFFWGPFAWKMVLRPFTLSLNVSLGSKWVSCRQQMDGSFFLYNLQPCGVLWAHLGHLHWDWLLRDMILMMPCLQWCLCFYRLWLSLLYNSWGIFTFIEPPLISPVGLVLWLQNWSMTGDCGWSLSLHQFWMTALLDKRSLAACSSQIELWKYAANTS